MTHEASPEARVRHPQKLVCVGHSALKRAIFTMNPDLAPTILQMMTGQSFVSLSFPLIFMAQLRGIATVSRPSVCPSATLIYRGGMCWVSSKLRK